MTESSLVSRVWRARTTKYRKSRGYQGLKRLRTREYRVKGSNQKQTLFFGVYKYRCFVISVSFHFSKWSSE